METTYAALIGSLGFLQLNTKSR